MYVTSGSECSKSVKNRALMRMRRWMDAGDQRKLPKGSGI